MHKDAHPQAGEIVTIQRGEYKGRQYRIEDWWDHLTGKSWGFSEGNIACLRYALRLVGTDIPSDDEVVYGKIDHLGYLIHVSELTE